MMSSRIETEILTYKSSIEKLLASDREGEIKDVLLILQDLPMTVDLLRTTLIGHSLNNIKKKYPTSDAGIQAKNIIAKWKTSCAAPAQSSSASSNASAKTDTQSPATVPDKSSLLLTEIHITESSNDNKTHSPDHDDASPRVNDFDITALLKKLPEARIKIIDLLSGHMKSDCDGEVAKFMAFCIEDAVNSAYDNDTDKKGYKDKLKSLSFNLKQNESLRKSLIDGSIQPSDLVCMSANELATEETRIARGKIAEEGFMERRSDLYEVKRGEIQAANGIDPNMGGEFTCKKCKSKKTTNYQMQTRSSDEPMTVFIRCLTCGNRWRF